MRHADTFDADRMTNIIDQLSPDTPISNRGEDALGYWAFAEALAKGVTQRLPRDGFVVGIQAHWGMGKTSAINLLLLAIEAAETGLPEARRTKVAVFNAWRHALKTA